MGNYNYFCHSRFEVNWLSKISSLLCLALLVTACKKDKDVLGVGVQPTDDAVDADFNSSAPVSAYTLKYDSVPTDNTSLKYLGINKDPSFGTTEVDLCMNMSLPDGMTYVSFGDDAQIVSSEIILTAYNLGESFVGSAGAIVSYSVFPLTALPDPERLNYTNNIPLYNSSTVLGAYTGSFTTLNGKIVLRIPVDKNFAGAILNNPQYIYSNAAFQNTYKGFYIRCSLTNDEGIIAKFDLDDSQSGFYLYYQNGTNSATKTDKTFRIIFGGNDKKRYNTVRHDFTGSDNLFKQQVVDKDTAKGADRLFLKGMGLSRVKVFIPSLKNYSDSFTVAVNRAELIFNIDPSVAHGPGYTPCPRLCLLPIDSTGKESFALDQLNSTDRARYGGTYDETANRYVFNIARHVQAVLSGKKKNCGFYLVVASAEQLASYTNLYVTGTKELALVERDNYIERVVLAGSNHPSLKPVLNLSYTKFKYD